MKEDYFWEAMENLSSQKNKTPITKDQLETIYDTLLELHDDDIWHAGNFVKICSHLQSCTVGEVARALLDLKKNNFSYEDTIDQEKITTDTKIEDWRISRFDHRREFFTRSQRIHTPRYPDRNINGGSDEMQNFLANHFSDLTPFQKTKLESLRPPYGPRPS